MPMTGQHNHPKNMLVCNNVHTQPNSFWAAFGFAQILENMFQMKKIKREAMFPVGAENEVVLEKTTKPELSQIITEDFHGGLN